MKQALTWAAGGTLFLFAMTTLGAATVFLFVREPRERLRRWLLGFAAGIMTAASVWSLLLPAMDRAAALGLPPWLPAAAGTGAGALFLWGLDALLPRLRPASGRTSRETALLVTAITLHNIPEGMAVGLSFALAAGARASPPLRPWLSASGCRTFRRAPPWPCPSGRRACVGAGPSPWPPSPGRWSPSSAWPPP